MSTVGESIPDMNLDDRKIRANQAFNLWSLKKSRYDKGLLLLSSVTDDRVEVRIEVGLPFLRSSWVNGVTIYHILHIYRNINFGNRFITSSLHPHVIFRV
jgi:hypothetical protein